MADSTGGIRMCSKTEFRAHLVQFDEELLEFFERWQAFLKQHHDKKKLEHVNWLDAFCSYVWESLEYFDKADRLKEPLKPQ